MSSNFAVKTEGLSKTFLDKEVIHSCTMSVPEGAIYGFLGPNGAGKTTVMKILLGLLTPTAGKVEVLGMDVTEERNKILTQVGSLIEIPVFFEHLSAEENLSLHLAYMNVEKADISKVLQMVGLVGTGSKPVSKFSLGMRQRLAIARSFIHHPKLLILDEPINGLDPVAVREMRNLFLTLVHDHGMTILLSSHIISEIEHIADIVGIIAEGRVEREIPIADIKTQFENGLEDYFFDIVSGGNQFA
ncbi:ATP-binding cassette domain-containing protein [Paenibacillus polygoni]|uniref:ATP-binding cassette domain-containing protein n=1 Tax=Paenibacillus polygoni TaxID=3050112 RepID=A0ABY8X2U9_9BACL|nr:ATP-binding cassette domain-containing protein [Paenibacillus polygoni]WIV17771.1 ATP-binding cassette domain-containing protein [Paenibacillus polygoni]